ELAKGYATSRTWYAVGALVPLFLFCLTGVPSSLFLILGLLVKEPAGGETALQKAQREREERRKEEEEERKKEKEKLPGGKDAKKDKDGEQPRKDKEKEKPGDDFVGKALAEAQAKSSVKRKAGLARLSKVPTYEKAREEFEAARADPVRRKEVAARLVEVLAAMRAYKEEAAKALELWVTPEVVPDLIDQLAQANPFDKAAIVKVLGASKDPRAVPALVGQLDMRTRPSHDAAVRALEAFGP